MGVGLLDGALDPLRLAHELRRHPPELRGPVERRHVLAVEPDPQRALVALAAGDPAALPPAVVRRLHAACTGADSW